METIFFIIIIYTLLSFKNLSRLHVHTWTLGSFIYEIPNLNSPISCNNGKKSTKILWCPLTKQKVFPLKNQIRFSPSLPLRSVTVLALICQPCPAGGLSWGRLWWPEQLRWPRWSWFAAPSAPQCAAGAGSEPLRLELHLRRKDRSFTKSWPIL